MYKMLNHSKKPADLHKDLSVYELPKCSHRKANIKLIIGPDAFEKQAINIHTAPWAPRKFFFLFSCELLPQSWEIGQNNYVCCNKRGSNFALGENIQ